MTTLPLDVMKISADSIRTLAMDAVRRANSGHQGTAMALADISVVLWSQFLKHDPQNPRWIDQDRFVLSCGHASMLLYSLLHLSGYDLSMDDIKAFRQWGSKTPGHPEFGHTDGVITTTGPLGQGITTAVGLALAERHLAATYNRADFDLINHYTYVIASDGDIMEGVSHEACSLAGHLGLDKLIVLYDDNKVTIDGTIDISMSENVGARFAAYGWHVIDLPDGHDMDAVHGALAAAREATGKPVLIVARTHIGYGSPNKVDTSAAHGAGLDADEVLLTKEALGWSHPPFHVPDDVYTFMQDTGGATAVQAWHDLFDAYAETYPKLAAQLQQVVRGELGTDWQAQLPTFATDGSKMATRAASGKVLDAIVPHAPALIGGSADLTGSNKTLIKGMGVFSADNPTGRYIYYGIREHGMAGVMNGLSLHGGLRPYGGTFLVFSDYMRGAMRLAALMGRPVVYVLTHDSIGLGEDGPTHQPIEHVMSLRAMPNLHVIRPADANETAYAWQMALERTEGPTALILTRQNLPVLDVDTAGTLRGGYVLRDTENPQAIIIATGSEVEIALDAQAQLVGEGIATRVVSIPCWEAFEAESAEYRASVLPTHIIARVSIEAGTPLGWERYTGTFGKIIGLDHFGASAPYEELYEQFGLSAEKVAAAVVSLLN